MEGAAKRLATGFEHQGTGNRRGSSPPPSSKRKVMMHDEVKRYPQKHNTEHVVYDGWQDTERNSVVWNSRSNEIFVSKRNSGHSIVCLPVGWAMAT